MLLLFVYNINALSAINSTKISIPKKLSKDEALVLYYKVDDLLAISYPASIRAIVECEDGTIYTYSILLQKGSHSLYWYPMQFSSAIRTIDVSIDQEKSQNFEIDIDTLSITLYIQKVSEFIKTASLYDMMQWQDMMSTHQDYTVFRWQQYPNTLVFFFKDKQIQSRYLKRIAFFLEKRGTRGSIRYDTEIAHRKGWGAHDYDMHDLRDFFELTRTQSFPTIDTATGIFPLHREELELKRLLIEQGLFMVSEKDAQNLQIQPYNYTMIANIPILSVNGSMVSIALSYSPALIKALLTHEILHVFYFYNKDLQNMVTKLWMNLEEQEQNIWKGFLAKNGYDETYNFLVQNEFFAYLLQRPLSVLSSYLRTRIISESGYTMNTLSQENFIKKMQMIAKQLERYVQQNFSIKAGSVMYVEKVK